MRLVCSLVLVLGGLQLTSALLVAAWNLHVFGKTKANLPGVYGSPPSPKKAAILKYIAEAIQKFDIIVIQEVIDNDPNEPVINALMTAVNRNQAPALQYDKIFSEPLCRGNCKYKERYLYIYKKSTVKKGISYQYLPVPHLNTFSRPPFVVAFQSIVDPTLQFVLIPQHTAPDYARCREIDALADVVKYVTHSSVWGPQNVLLLGDFNAGVTYVSSTDWEDIRLRTDRDFHWLIDDNMNTAVSQRPTPANPNPPPYAYDRIVANTLMMPRVATVPGGPIVAGPIDFEQQWGLPGNPPGIQAKDISDHLIVHVQLQ